jgi:hypothetical protein
MTRTPRRIYAALAIALATVLATVLAPSVPASAGGSHHKCPLPVFGPGDQYHPQIDRKSFSPNVDNRWFPLSPGTTYVYTGIKDDKKALDIVVVTSRTKKIDGVRTRVVEDRNYLDNELSERTSDYYAQDKCGNVWYFGEDTAELDAHGNVIDTSGSFHAGVDGAQPGVFMQKHPELGRRFRQEWLKGEAEDTFKAIDLDAHVRVRFGSFDHALRTEEKTALEPDVVDNKYYVKGIGEVLEKTVKGGNEHSELVEVIR